ncbi:MAG: flavodoxin [Acidimicrobiia bacterium]|nr:flavodoxin [Acidimicrobiia bacterium]
MRVLVSAGTKHGATAEIAERIGEVLISRGFEIEVTEPTDVGELDAFDAFVLGSAVYAGHWRAEARDLVQRVAASALDRPVWLFSSGPLGDPPKPDDDAVDVAELVKLVSAWDHCTFAGRLERARLGFGERAIVAALRAPEGDFRDWDLIAGWAAGIAEELDVRRRA